MDSTTYGLTLAESHPHGRIVSPDPFGNNLNVTAFQLQSRLTFHQILFRPMTAYLVQSAYQRGAIWTRQTDSVRCTTVQMIR